MAIWLFKTEPDVYGLNDLKNEANGMGIWNGIRNYQARNFLRDAVKVGDDVLIYHSSCKPAAIVGLAKVVKAAYADPLQYDGQSNYFDAKSTMENPRWFNVDIQYQETFKKPLTLDAIKHDERLAEMLLLKQGRLSVMPVTEQQFKIILSEVR